MAVVMVVKLVYRYHKDHILSASVSSRMLHVTQNINHVCSNFFSP